MANDERDELKNADARHSRRSGRFVAEEAALDRLLALAPREGAIEPSALLSRIVGAAKSEGPPPALEGAGAAPGNVMPMRPRPGPIPKVASSGVWPAAVALAASLVLGVLGGASSIGEPALSGIFEIAGLAATSADADAATGDGWEAFSLDTATSLEELL